MLIISQYLLLTADMFKKILCALFFLQVYTYIKNSQVELYGMAGIWTCFTLNTIRFIERVVCFLVLFFLIVSILRMHYIHVSV